MKIPLTASHRSKSKPNRKKHKTQKKGKKKKPKNKLKINRKTNLPQRKRNSRVRLIPVMNRRVLQVRSHLRRNSRGQEK